MKNIKDAVNKTLKNIRTSIIGTITSVLAKDKKVFIRIADEEIRDIKVISHYGFFSLPLNNQNGQILFNNSNKKAVFIGIEHNNVPVELKPGEVIVYCESGSHILLKDNKIIIKGDLNVDGNITYTSNISKG